jgi:RNA-splicing ligase RtcB
MTLEHVFSGTKGDKMIINGQSYTVESNTKIDKDIDKVVQVNLNRAIPGKVARKRKKRLSSHENLQLFV